MSAADNDQAKSQVTPWFSNWPVNWAMNILKIVLESSQKIPVPLNAKKTQKIQHLKSKKLLSPLLLNYSRSFFLKIGKFRPWLTDWTAKRPLRWIWLRLLCVHWFPGNVCPSVSILNVMCTLETRVHMTNLTRSQKVCLIDLFKGLLYFYNKNLHNIQG